MEDTSRQSPGNAGLLTPEQIAKAEADVQRQIDEYRKQYVDVGPPYGLPDDESLRLFWKELSEQTHRGIAVLGAAFLEWRVRDAIRSRMRICDGHTTNIFGSDKKGGRLGFVEQSQVAYSMGLIGPETVKDIKQVAEIRNKFAHHPSISSFDHATVAPMVEKLNAPGQYYADINAAGGPKWKLATDRRVLYIITIKEIALRIWSGARFYAFYDDPKLGWPLVYR